MQPQHLRVCHDILELEGLKVPNCVYWKATRLLRLVMGLPPDMLRLYAPTATAVLALCHDVAIEPLWMAQQQQAVAS